MRWEGEGPARRRSRGVLGDEVITKNEMVVVVVVVAVKD